MTLASGTRLGPYEILGQVGAGGMGEVYRARDTRLLREVALKILPAELSEPERLRRFEQEARSASALNHPNIVVVYDVGREGSVSYIAMELVDGRTLRELVVHGPLPIRRILPLATQIADGLARAHAAGIVHRDLKPENVMVTADGFVKILDFGLALRRPLDAAGREQAAAAHHPMAQHEFTSAPTSESRFTETGVILGTVGYLSPEQAAGKGVDYRSDQFAFGAMVYEMLTGKRAFQGASAAETMTAVIRSEPDPVTSLRPETPAPLSWVIERCLAKEPTERYESTRDLAKDLATVRDRASSPGMAGLTIAPSRPLRDRWIPWAMAAVAAIAAIALAVARLREKPAQPRTIRFVISPPKKGQVISGQAEAHDLAVAPDGSRIAFVASVEGQTQIWIRELRSLETVPLKGTENSESPFWSPDGRSLGFFADGKLKTISAAGGPPQTVCAATGRDEGAWGAGTIVFAQRFSLKDGLYAVAASGGEPRTLTFDANDAEGARWPRFLPDGRRYLFLARDKEGKFLAAAELGSSRIQSIARLASRFELSSGHLFFVKDGVLVARIFDASHLRLGDDTTPVADRIPFFDPSGWTPFSAAGNVIAYQDRPTDVTLRWVDRQGATLSTVGSPGVYATLRLSPDGTMAAVEKIDPATGLTDLWIADLSRDVMTRFTADPGSESSPVWSPDGAEIAFVAHGKAPPELRRKRLDDSTSGEVLLREGFPWPTDWTKDGRLIAFTFLGEPYAMGLLPLSGDKKPSPFRKTRFNEGGAVFSPDGRWVAFGSDESDHVGMYIVSSSGSGPTRQVSSKEASPVLPIRWRADGKELFYGTQDGELMAVPVREQDGRIESGAPVPLFRIPPHGQPSYDVSADGQRFLLNRGQGLVEQPISVIADWSPPKGPR